MIAGALLLASATRYAIDAVKLAPLSCCASGVHPAGQVCAALFFVMQTAKSRCPVAMPAGSAGVSVVAPFDCVRVPTAAYAGDATA